LPRRSSTADRKNDFVIDGHRDEHGIELICHQLPIAVSTYYEQKARQSDPDRELKRSKRDQTLEGEVQRVWDEN